MEINGVIKQTALMAENIIAEVQIVINEQGGTASFMLPTSIENIGKLLAITGRSYWEQIAGAPVKCRLEEESQGYRLAAIGHFMVDQWIEIPKPEEDCDCEKECNCEDK